MASVINQEPVAVFVAGLIAAITAGLALAATFDWVPLDAGQAASLVAFVTIAGAAIGTALRDHVFSPATVAQLKGA